MDINLNFSKDDVAAIILALKFSLTLDFDDPIQATINANLCISAWKKLSTCTSCTSALEEKEFRAIITALEYSVLMLSGNQSKLFSYIDPDLRREMAPYFFTLNKLNAALRDLA